MKLANAVCVLLNCVGYGAY